MAGQAQTYNQLAGLVGTGLSAGGAIGGVGIQNAGQVGNALQAAAGAQAAGVVGASNALYGPQGGFTGFGQSLANAGMLAGKYWSGDNTQSDAAYESSVMREIYGYDSVT